MPLAIDEEALKKRETLDVSAPQGTAHGLPVKSIPHYEFPRVVYLHPSEPFMKIEHRNDRREIVQVETVATEHEAKTVGDADELEAALAEGYVLVPYLQKAPPDPRAKIYKTKK